MDCRKKYFTIAAALITGIGTLSASPVHAQTAEQSEPPAAVEENIQPPESGADEAIVQGQPECSMKQADGGLITLDMPGNGWTTLTAKNIQDKEGKGCIPRRIPDGLLLVLQNEQKSAGLYVLKSTEKVVFKNENALQSYVTKQRAKFKDSEEENKATLISLETAQIDEGIYINRVEFETKLSRGSGGCTPNQQTGQGDLLRQIVVEYFIHPAGQNNLALYRIAGSIKDDAVDEIMPVFQRVFDSFQYQGKVADQFFIPAAAENKLPEVGGGADVERTTPWGLYALLAVAVIYFFWRWKKRQAQTTSG